MHQGMCFAAKDVGGFLREDAGIYKFLQNAEPFCGEMRGFAGNCKAQFVIVGTFCGKIWGYCKCIATFVMRFRGNAISELPLIAKLTKLDCRNVLPQ